LQQAAATQWRPCLHVGAARAGGIERAIVDHVAVGQRQFDLVADDVQLAVEQGQRMRAEVRHAERADTSRHLFLAYPVGDRGRLHQRIEAMQHQHIHVIGLQVAQAGVQRRAQVAYRQVVVLDAARVARTAAADDADLGQQVEPLPQAGTRRQRVADQRIGRVVAVDVGQVEGVDAGIQRSFEQTRDGAWRQVRAPTAETHGAEDRRGLAHVGVSLGGDEAG